MKIRRSNSGRKKAFLDEYIELAGRLLDSSVSWFVTALTAKEDIQVWRERERERKKEKKCLTLILIDDYQFIIITILVILTVVPVWITSTWRYLLHHVQHSANKASSLLIMLRRWLLTQNFAEYQRLRPILHDSVVSEHQIRSFSAEENERNPTTYQHPISPSNNKTVQFIIQSKQKKNSIRKTTSVQHIPLSKAETIAGIRRNTFPHPIGCQPWKFHLTRISVAFWVSCFDRILLLQ